ncbi:DUF6417 family protein [Streptomyces silvisoli]|uniref:DUF6417 family protein n=1 Tax=Streptomyces silvisoli TaxID=3034235 RepID=A0ABT5ZTN8_9ACTN|nr:DUF6417 family protein [Streptomyces silvisoli]MDF3292373.1 DUF6417 family protein [Streptomyces silvisoli]
MELRPQDWELLETVRERMAADEWWTCESGEPDAGCRRLAERGLVELAVPAPGRGEGWAVRLTVHGSDALVYRELRAVPADAEKRWLTKQADPAYRELGLVPSEMDLVRGYVRITEKLQGLLAPLDDAVVEAVWDEERRGWLLQVSEAEAREIGRVLFLEALQGSVRPRNRVAREHEIRYSPVVAGSYE